MGVEWRRGGGSCNNYSAVIYVTTTVVMERSDIFSAARFEGRFVAQRQTSNKVPEQNVRTLSRKAAYAADRGEGE